MIPGGIQDGPADGRPRSIDQAFERARITDPRPLGVEPTLSYRIDVYATTDEAGDRLWHVSLLDKRHGAQLVRDYTRWDEDHPRGMFPDQAAQDLLEIAALGGEPTTPAVPSDRVDGFVTDWDAGRLPDDRNA